MESTRQIINDAILHESIFIIGTVSSVEGRKVKVLVKRDKNLSHLSYNGTLIKNVSVGSYIKISKGYVDIIGKVEGEYTTRNKGFNAEYKKEESEILRYLDVSLFGHFENGHFCQGIKEMPLIDNQCFLLTTDELQKLHRFHNTGEKTIAIGTLTDDPSQTINVGISKLFASHTGIFGNTGSGKSNTLAKLFTSLFESYESNPNFRNHARFLFIDLNGEYSRQDTLSTRKKVFNLSTRTQNGDKYPIQTENLERLEILSVLLEATEKTQRPFLNRALSNDFLNADFENRAKERIRSIVSAIVEKGDPLLRIKIFNDFFDHLRGLVAPTDTSVPAILRNLTEGKLKFHAQNSTYYTTTGQGDIYANANAQGVIDAVFPALDQIQIISTDFSKIKFKILSQYYFEIINGYSVEDHLRPLIGRMFKKFGMLQKVIQIDDNNQLGGSSLEILNLKDTNLELKKTLPLIIVKQLYDKHKETDDFTNKSLHIVIDEAHNLLSAISERESETWKDYRLETFEEVIKEGRKFSTFLTIASQRPYDISPTIISQLHNYFIHRLINEHDIRAIEKAVAYLDKLSFESIPVLGIGSCFFAGLASDIPVKVDIDLLPDSQRPRSETIDLSRAWNNDFAEQEAAETVVEPVDPDDIPF